MGRNNEDFDDAHALANDPVAHRLAAKGIYKNDIKAKPYDEYMDEPDFDRD
jgi:hypothetical protein